jgi:hypothetical protein
MKSLGPALLAEAGPGGITEAFGHAPEDVAEIASAHPFRGERYPCWTRRFLAGRQVILPV